MAAAIKNLEQVNMDLQEQKERVETLDFKMITFSLAGKDYGVDIMNVKEIAKADKFTYVPNAAAFVRGVYNLRG
ncbi:MAG: chemotaxis protein CheW, partial [Treponema sp.]|nr:chemotaxis protein CheW [Treponema sp.]